MPFMSVALDECRKIQGDAGAASGSGVVKSLQPPPPGLGLGTYFLQQKKLEAQAKRARRGIDEPTDKVLERRVHAASLAGLQGRHWASRWANVSRALHSQPHIMQTLVAAILEPQEDMLTEDAAGHDIGNLVAFAPVVDSEAQHAHRHRKMGI